MVKRCLRPDLRTRAGALSSGDNSGCCTSYPVFLGGLRPSHGSNLRCCCSTNIAKSCFCFACICFRCSRVCPLWAGARGYAFRFWGRTLVMRCSLCAGRLICWNGEEKKHSPRRLGRMLRKDSKGAMLLSSSAMEVHQTMLDQSSLAKRTWRVQQSRTGCVEKNKSPKYSITLGHFGGRWQTVCK